MMKQLAMKKLGLGGLGMKKSLVVFVGLLVALTVVNTSYVTYVSATESIMTATHIKLGATDADSVAVMSELQRLKEHLIVQAVVLIMISLVLTFAVLNVLYRPILELKRTITDLSEGEGDLTQRLTTQGNDDIAQIGNAVNTFITNLQGMMLDIAEASGKLGSSVDTLKAHSGQSVAEMERHVNETEQVVTAINQMSVTAKSVAEDVSQTASFAEQARKVGEESAKPAREGTEAFMSLITEVETTSRSIQTMSNETESIKTILEVINGIAEQTNLLALNAAIEAARAGEHGRGFAVVADEVRTLAARTRASTQQVEESLARLLEQNGSVVDSMEKTKSMCYLTGQKVELIGKALGDIIAIVHQMSTTSGQIATSTEEQSSVTQEISQNMALINTIVNQLNQSSMASSEQVGGIARVNEQLMAIVGRFELGEASS
ncbi:methyl-accepting chemotaxis protein [Photobacterium sp. OFAV2-7]|uniref:methyl-accepting chemotaxis protein n=1 Tax=Photobacterium sp. OFAV2-7 TaxID=2917748 RepID=UPI001EF4BEEA|nr:methyl-accepting chemotaxis protein [Photobacterium sp. OFAV2-7]MCG7584327.1 methyl-accepting chemotaxis protein [Photobacterium sp. OFAV2-7]